MSGSFVLRLISAGAPCVCGHLIRYRTTILHTPARAGKAQAGKVRALPPHAPGDVCNRAAIVGRIVRSKSVGLRPSKLGVAAELTHLPLASVLVRLVIHANIALRLALVAVFQEESRIASVKNVDVGVEQGWVAVHVQLAVALTQLVSPVNVLAMCRLEWNVERLTCEAHGAQSTRSER